MSKYYTQGNRVETPEDDFNDRQSYGMGSRQHLTQPGRDDYRYQESSPMNQGFDVRADFDGDGPRWSEMYGVAKHETYRPVYDHDIDEPGGLGAPKPHLNQAHRDPEMVSIPVLGAEWTKDELVGQSKRGKKRAKRDERGDHFRAWNRDQKGCCGIPWMTRTVFVFLFFLFIVALIITLYFVIPRAVAFKWYEADIMSVSLDTLNVNRIPTNFSFDAELHVLADTTSSWIPVQFSGADAKVFDAATSSLIATGHLGRITLKHGKDIPVLFPVQFEYSALNISDPTWTNLYNACRFPEVGVQRTGLNWMLEIKQHIVGMVSQPVIQTSVLAASCPFNMTKAT